MSGMTDRDHFAAAALTGLLASGMDSVDEMPTRAYRMADAMLRERERTNHDAAPAARASVESVAPQPTTGDGAWNPPSHNGTGSTQEPVAWSVEQPNGEFAVLAFKHPLYRAPTLTDAERDDLRVWLAECLRQRSAATEGANEELAERWQARATRAAAMIERMGGGR